MNYEYEIVSLTPVSQPAIEVRLQIIHPPAEARETIRWRSPLLGLALVRQTWGDGDPEAVIEPVVLDPEGRPACISDLVGSWEPCSVIHESRENYA